MEPEVSYDESRHVMLFLSWRMGPSAVCCLLHWRIWWPIPFVVKHSLFSK